MREDQRNPLWHCRGEDRLFHPSQDQSWRLSDKASNNEGKSDQERGGLSRLRENRAHLAHAGSPAAPGRGEQHSHGTGSTTPPEHERHSVKFILVALE